MSEIFDKPDVIILAGGLGTRLRPVVSDRPKVLAEIAGKPFLHWILQDLSQQNLQRVIIAAGYMAEQIEDYFQQYPPAGMEIIFSREETALGTAGALKLALPYLQSQQILVMNGDSYCAFKWQDLAEIHFRRQAMATIAVVSEKAGKRFGLVEMDREGCIQCFHEKPDTDSMGFISGGIYFFERDVLESFPSDQVLSLEKNIFPGLVQKKGLYGCVQKGPLLDIGTPESFAEANKVLKQMLLSHE